MLSPGGSRPDPWRLWHLRPRTGGAVVMVPGRPGLLLAAGHAK
jgi:hypothetical protein